MSSVTEEEPATAIELTHQPRVKPWCSFAARSIRDADSPSSSGRFLFSNGSSWLNPFSRLPATPSNCSTAFEDVALDASDTSGAST